MGIYIVNKPLGKTSFDAVAIARKQLGTKSVGHTGTLDPLATGVLILATDSSTKLVQFLTADSKDYLAFISLGASTPTLDAEGPILESKDVPDFSSDQIKQVLEKFVGVQLQMPPIYSAIHVNGERAYDLARAGKEFKLELRNVTIHKLEFLKYGANLEGVTEGVPHNLPTPLGNFSTMLVFASVSSGTYLRSLARDVGEALGVPAHLSGLIRTRVGKFKLENAVELEDLRDATPIPELDALEIPRIEVTAKQAKDARDGKKLEHDAVGQVVLTCDGQLVAVVDGDGSRLKVIRAWQQQGA
jgi:tRNA pseudouridine55 synthase